MNPRDRSDFRERVRRETFRGKTTFFHENIEQYMFRQAKAYTTFRVFSHWVLAYAVALRCKYFNNIFFKIFFRYLRFSLYFP